MLRRLGLPALALLLAGGCRHTRVEVATQVDLQGGATRTITVVSEDGGNPAEHPSDFRPGAGGYAVLQREKGRYRAQGMFSSVASAPSAFGFGGRDGGASAGSTTRFQKVDWVLFHQCRYAEVVRDLVDADAVKDGLDQASIAFAELLEDTFREMFGEDFDDAVLRKRLRTDLREMLREVVFISWQELSRKGADEAAGNEMDRFAQRCSRVFAKYDLKLSTKVLMSAFEGDPDEPTPELRELRGAVARWVEEGLKPVEKGNRVILVPDIESTLFDGPFALAFMEATRKRFGGQAEAEAWFEARWEQVFGVFGPNRGDITFHFRVKLPGMLLRSNGYLQNDGWTFLEFPAGEIYPDGKGIECESVVWEPSVIGVLPAAALVQTNETALQWMWIVGDGPEGSADPDLAAHVRACAEARSLDPLRDAIDALRESTEDQQQNIQQLERLLAWLEGERG